MEKIKISQLPTATSLDGLFIMGTDSNNRSVKISMQALAEYIESINIQQQETQANDEQKQTKNLILWHFQVKKRT